MTIEVFFRDNKRAAIAFSGGVDSAFLLWAARKAGADVTAYYVRSQFQPVFEFEDAVRIAEAAGADLRVIEADVLSDPVVRSNPPDRCYHCKKLIMSSIREAAGADGYTLLCDGTNASDDADDRPGFRALGEFGIRSPLRECGLTKSDIRQAARDAGLDVWDKPAYACLATRIKTGEEITAEKLRITEQAEEKLAGMGFRDFRVRMRDGSALIQVREEQHEEAAARMEEIREAIGGMYSRVVLDDNTR